MTSGPKNAQGNPARRTVAIIAVVVLVGGLLSACASVRIPLSATLHPPVSQKKTNKAIPQTRSVPVPTKPKAVVRRVQRTPPPEPGARPPVLPSLKELLSRMPKPQKGLAVPPPGIPAVRGMRVAVLLPLSGPNRNVGQSLLNAAEKALFDFAGMDFEMTVHDTRGTPDGAAVAAQLAVGDGAQLILGPLLSASVRAASIPARAADVPVLAFSSDRTVAGNGIYTMGFFPGDEVRRVVAYAAAKGALRFALLAPRGTYGDTVLAALKDAAAKAGGVVTQTEFYDPHATNFSVPVKRIAHYAARHEVLLNQRRALEARGGEVSALALKRLSRRQTLGTAPFDAVLVADGGKRLVAVAAMLPFYDIDPDKVKILGTGQWDVKGLGSEPALVGGWYAAPDPAARKAFSRAYFKAFASRPHRLATLAYDATALAVVLGKVRVTDGGPLRRFDRTALSKPSGFAGRDGIFRFPLGGAVERGFAVMEVQRRGMRVIDPAPTAFRN